MAFGFGFYDSIESGGTYDRLYSADDFSSFFDGVLSDGVLRSYGACFNITIKNADTREITIGTGKAWLNGTWNILDEPMELTIPSHSTNHLEALILKIDKSARENTIFLRAFEDEITVITDEDREIYEYCLAGIRVTNNKIIRVESHIGKGTPMTPYAAIIVSGQGGGVGHHWNPDFPDSGGEYFNNLTNIASGIYSHAEGRSSATGECGHSEGSGPQADGNYSHAEGNNTLASGLASHAEGGSSEARNQFSHAEGWHTIASGDASHAEGYETTVEIDARTGSHAEGYNTVVSGPLGAHAEGNKTTASGQSSHAEGMQTKAEGNWTHAEGVQTTAQRDAAHAEGYRTTASGEYAPHSEGHATIASGQSSHAEGQETIAQGTWSHAEGKGTTASGRAAHAEGMQTISSGETAHAEGYDTLAEGSYSHAGGMSGIASNLGAFVHGDHVSSSSDYQTVFGKYNNAYADGDYALIIGNGTDADHLSDALTVDWDGNVTCKSIRTSDGSGSGSGSGSGTTSGVGQIESDPTCEIFNSYDGENKNISGAENTTGSLVQYCHAEGIKTSATGQYGSHAEGHASSASGESSHAEGMSTIASGNYTHAEGSGSKSIGESSHAEGQTTKAEGFCSHVEGYESATSDAGSYAHAEGQHCTASESSCHAEGDHSAASAPASHAEGGYTGASGAYAHAEGYDTDAVGEGSHSEGKNTRAQGNGSHAEGYKTNASGNYSHAGGNNSKATSYCSFVHGNGLLTSDSGSDSQAVFGEYNVAESQKALIIGGGTSDTDRKNIFSVDKSGNVSCSRVSCNGLTGLMLQDLPVVFKPYDYVPEQTNTPRIIGIKADTPTLTGDTHYVTQIVSWYVELPNDYQS